jgi:hypothetical protein
MAWYSFYIEPCIVASEEKKAAEDDDEDQDTTASRFTARFLNFLLKGFVAKDKSVRYRVLQTVAEMVSYLGEIEYVLCECSYTCNLNIPTVKKSTWHCVLLF